MHHRPLSLAPLAALLLLAALLASLAIAPPTAGQAATEDATAADVAARVEGSAVTVYTYTGGGAFAPGRTGQEPTGAGSGWVYADDLVVTNAHVVLGVDEVRVVTADGAVIEAEVVGTDWYQDVAVLRLLPGDGGAPPAATVGDSSRVRAGDRVIAIGTPLGQFANTATVGHVTATGRSLNTGTGYSVRNLIQHDAPLSPGSSGGPLVSMDGTVIGMNVARADAPAGEIGYAIDGNTVVAIAEEILATGSVDRPWLGVRSEAGPQGTVVSGVEPGSPAEAAGLRPGDRIVGVGDARVDATQGYIDLLYRHEPGDTVTLTVVRDGAEVIVEVELGSRPAGL